MRRNEVHPLPTDTWPVDEWRLVETDYDDEMCPRSETLFALSNGYLGLRGNVDEGRPADRHVSLVNGFHETWPIAHAEDAYGFARVGQTILHVPDAKLIRLYIDDEPLYVPTARISEYERSLDMRTGVLERKLVWDTPAGYKATIRTRRLVSYRYRHLAAICYEVLVEGGDVPIALSSWLLNRQETDNPEDPSAERDPRTTRQFSGRVYLGKESVTENGRAILAYRTAASHMTIGCGVDHLIETPCLHQVEDVANEDYGKVVYTVSGVDGAAIRLTKYASYHTSTRAPASELANRARRTLDRAMMGSFEDLVDDQREHLDRFWSISDVQLDTDEPRHQQAVRWNLFQLYQNTVRSDGAGIPAKGLTGDGYEGHYFWDIDVYVMPFLTYTQPRVASNLVRFRLAMLDAARARATELGHNGALFPWRTIDGQEASAYYAAGTAQYHLNADIVYAAERYVRLTGDYRILEEGGGGLVTETARLWYDLGFFDDDGVFHLHAVTGPDEYTTVVNDNLYTNVMARHNLLRSAQVMERFKAEAPGDYERFAERLGLADGEVTEWRRAADNMYVPYDAERGIHPQDDVFLDREVWDFAGTPDEKYPLLLHFHPLEIYRKQVIKQADVVLAHLLVGDNFTPEERRRDFDYYEKITTGDSSLSPCVESIIAAEVGHAEAAMDYFRESLYMDLADVAGNVGQGAHVASIGGTWMALVYGFGGFREWEGLTFDPRLPETWSRLQFSLLVWTDRLDVEITHEAIRFRLHGEGPLTVGVRGSDVELQVGTPVTVPLAGS